ncbi:unnamed protein product [Rangifer tarandus platyrhynchus]|uniref:Uncharacterized protein n=1 Tax=Rangifer tarandus platyrhynchus TaxID=3082113 RepID=A0AC59YML9_RANTA
MGSGRGTHSGFHISSARKTPRGGNQAQILSGKEGSELGKDHALDLVNLKLCLKPCDECGVDIGQVHLRQRWGSSDDDFGSTTPQCLCQNRCSLSPTEGTHCIVV